jgi:predicted NBD/HSP70 family sugar kinase
MDVSQQTVSRLTSALVDMGLVEVAEKVSEGKRGKPSVVLNLSASAMYSVGFTIMMDTVSFAAMDFSGSVVFESQASLPTMLPRMVLDTCHSMFSEFLRSANTNHEQILGIGVAVTGYFVRGQPGFNTPPGLAEWAFVDIEETFNQEFDLPVWAENDGNAAAIGESMIGVGRWANSFAYIYLSSGLGGGVVIDGELVRGDIGNAGEFSGILPYSVHTHPTLELLRQISCRDGIELENIHELIEKFDPDWPSVDEWIHKTQTAFSIIASAASAVLDCTAVVLGGRMPRTLAEKLIPHIEFFSAPRRSFPRPTPRVVPAEAKGEVTAIGAATLPLRAMYFS